MSYTPLRPIPRIIFASRWLQLPLYLGLIVAQGVYVYHFLVEVWHLLSHVTTFDETKIMLVVLGLIDVVMISNLLIMVIVGGYETFVSRLGIDNHPDEPEWLEPRQCRRAEGEAVDGADRHFVDPPAKDLHRRRTALSTPSCGR